MEQVQSTSLLTCQQCGNQFDRPGLRGPPPKYCSAQCKKRAKNQHDYAAFLVRLQANEPRRCAVCGIPFHPRHASRQFCSNSCSNLARRTKPLVCPVQACQCVQCGQWFIKHGAGARRKLCSAECVRIWTLEHRRQQYRETFVSVRHTNPTVDLVCTQCGKTYHTNYRAMQRKFCSSECAHKFNTQQPAFRAQRSRQRHTRRIRLVGNAPIDRFTDLEIFERDGWKCGICGRKVDQRLKYPHLMSASLDHIVPIAFGGGHTRANVQLAHFICNSKKSDGGNGQLRLII